MIAHCMRIANSIYLYYFFQFVKERTASLIAKIKRQSRRQAADSRLAFTARRKWWRLTGSNRRPPACKAGALPAELNPHGLAASILGGSGWVRTNDPRVINTVL